MLGDPGCFGSTASDLRVTKVQHQVRWKTFFTSPSGRSWTSLPPCHCTSQLLLWPSWRTRRDQFCSSQSHESYISCGQQVTASQSDIIKRSLVSGHQNWICSYFKYGSYYILGSLNSREWDSGSRKRVTVLALLASSHPFCCIVAAKLWHGKCNKPLGDITGQGVSYIILCPMECEAKTSRES